MKIKTYIEMNQANIYIQVIFRFFDSMNCFSFSQCIALSHAQYIDVSEYIYIYIYTFGVYGLIGRRPSTHECMFIRSALLLVIFFFLLRTVYNLSNIKL